MGIPSIGWEIYICLTIYMIFVIYRTMNIDAETLFSAMANPVRLRCLLLLYDEQELCVCELTHALGLAQPAISRHLALLRETGLVRDRRRGLWIYYRLHPELPEWVTRVLNATTEGNRDALPFREDRAALANMPNRPGAACCA